MNNFTRKAAAILAGVALVCAIVYWFWPGTKEVTEKEFPLIQVEVVKPVSGGLERLSTQPAIVQSFEYVDLFSEVTGILTDQTVDINSPVKRGQVLARIYAPDVIKDRDLAKETLAQTKDKVTIAVAHLDLTHARLRAAVAVVLRRQAELVASEAYLAFRKVQKDRYTQLASDPRPIVDPRVAAEERDRYEAAKYRREQGVLAITQAEEDVNAWHAEVKQNEEAVKVAKAEVAVAQAALDKAQVFVDFTEIKAPFDGVITFRSLNNRAFIRAKERGSQVPLLTVRRTDLFRVITYVPAVNVPFVKIGDPVELHIPTLAKAFPGKVARCALSQQENSRLMRTEADMENRDNLLRDGMYGDMTIRINDVAKINPNVVTIPSICLQDEGQSTERTVYILQPASEGRQRVHVATVLIGYNQDKGKLNKKTVKREDLRVEILRGLTPEDHLVKGKVAGLVEGSLVALKK